MGSSLHGSFLPRVKGLAPRLDGKQDDENDGEKSTVCKKTIMTVLVKRYTCQYIYFHVQ